MRISDWSSDVCSSDLALLGILSHSTLALGLVMVAFMAWVRIDLLSYLFGDLLAVSRLDIAVIWGGGAAVLASLALIWRPLLAGTVSAELAGAAAMRPGRADRRSTRRQDCHHCAARNPSL